RPRLSYRERSVAADVGGSTNRVAAWGIVKPSEATPARLAIAGRVVHDHAIEAHDHVALRPGHPRRGREREQHGNTQERKSINPPELHRQTHEKSPQIIRSYLVINKTLCRTAAPIRGDDPVRVDNPPPGRTKQTANHAMG